VGVDIVVNCWNEKEKKKEQVCFLSLFCLRVATPLWTLLNFDSTSLIG
jgi:hypothetical protein